MGEFETESEPIMGPLTVLRRSQGQAQALESALESSQTRIKPESSLQKTSRFDNVAAESLLRLRWREAQRSLATATTFGTQNRACPFPRMFAEACAAFDDRAAKPALSTMSQPAVVAARSVSADADDCTGRSLTRAYSLGRSHSQRTRGRRGGSRRVKGSGAVHSARLTGTGTAAGANANAKQRHNSRKVAQSLGHSRE